MKTHRSLFEKIVTFENLWLAAKEASQGKRAKGNVAAFNYNLEENLVLLQQALIEKTYCPGGYRAFYIFDPKKRLISAAPFADRVVHHALCNVIEPLFDRTFIYDAYANRQGKGTHVAIKRAQKFLRGNRFVLKCDIKKYFPSIDHELLKQEIRWRIADPDALWLIDTIIDGSNEQEFVYDLFPGDDLFTPLERRKGLPLGNLTSQFFANLFLNRFDHFIKEVLQVRYYARYVDDFLLASNNIAFLKRVKQEIEAYLANLRLKLHPKKCHILRSDKGVPFLGQVIFPHYRLLKEQNVKRFSQRLPRLIQQLDAGDITQKRFNASIQGWKGHAVQANTIRLRQAFERKYFEAGLLLTD
ncbi:MAG: reverse transcriptase/maturase family protein [candidate division KSB1 bacterium]|nr:reverse transcriptase/maturase family protein [candidate division KSB1 bacterium]